MTPVSPSKLPVISVHLLQMKKIQHRKRYLKKQKAETSSKDNELDLLGEGGGDSFTGSNADLESAADNLFTLPPILSHLPSVLYLSKHQPSLFHPPQVRLYNKKFKQLFQASMLEAFQSLREEFTAKKQTEVDQTSFLASKPGTSSKTAVNLDLPPSRPSTNI